MDYKLLLEHSYQVVSTEIAIEPISRLEYLSEYIFDFTTYDSAMSELFAGKAIEVCAAINDKKTFEYIEDPEDYRWFLLMCNMPFFQDRLEWGTSIRGAWWSPTIGTYMQLRACGLWVAEDQLTETLKFSPEGWKGFIAALVEFAGDRSKT